MAAPYIHRTESQIKVSFDSMHRLRRREIKVKHQDAKVVRPPAVNPQVSYLERVEDSSVTVFVELGNLAAAQWEPPLKYARELLIGFAQNLAQTKL